MFIISCYVFFIPSAYGVVLLNTGHYDDAIYHLNDVVMNNANLVGAYYTRGAAYAKKGVRVGFIQISKLEFTMIIFI